MGPSFTVVEPQVVRGIIRIRDGLGTVRIEVIDLDQLDKLIQYFEGRPHPNLRLRPYYRGIIIPFTKDSFNLIF